MHAGTVAVPRYDQVWLVYHRRGTDTEVELGGHGATGVGTVDHGLVEELVRALDELRTHPDLLGSDLHLAADHPADSLEALPEAVADAVGLPHRRDLLQLRRVLPVPVDHPTRATAPAITTRPFRRGHDDDAWIRVNNQAFAAHPDQGHETPDTLAVRTTEAWFDADGFLVADDTTRPGELSGFCWTKVHDATSDDPALGEIYVIGVDPSHRGEGLGPSFVLAGLDHLAGRGLTTADLYVDADNEPARRLYDRLGFVTHHRRRVYTS